MHSLAAHSAQTGAFTLPFQAVTAAASSATGKPAAPDAPLQTPFLDLLDALVADTTADSSASPARKQELTAERSQSVAQAVPAAIAAMALAQIPSAPVPVQSEPELTAANPGEGTPDADLLPLDTASLLTRPAVDPLSPRTMVDATPPHAAASPASPPSIPALPAGEHNTDGGKSPRTAASPPAIAGTTAVPDPAVPKGSAKGAEPKIASTDESGLQAVRPQAAAEQDVPPSEPDTKAPAVRHSAADIETPEVTAEPVSPPAPRWDPALVTAPPAAKNRAVGEHTLIASAVTVPDRSAAAPVDNPPVAPAASASLPQTTVAAPAIPVHSLQPQASAAQSASRVEPAGDRPAKTAKKSTVLPLNVAPPVAEAQPAAAPVPIQPIPQAAQTAPTGTAATTSTQADAPKISRPWPAGARAAASAPAKAATEGIARPHAAEPLSRTWKPPIVNPAVPAPPSLTRTSAEPPIPPVFMGPTAPAQTADAAPVSAEPELAQAFVAMPIADPASADPPMPVAFTMRLQPLEAVAQPTEAAVPVAPTYSPRKMEAPALRRTPSGSIPAPHSVEASAEPATPAALQTESQPEIDRPPQAAPPETPVVTSTAPPERPPVAAAQAAPNARKPGAQVGPAEPEPVSAPATASEMQPAQAAHPVQAAAKPERERRDENPSPAPAAAPLYHPSARAVQEQPAGQSSEAAAPDEAAPPKTVGDAAPEPPKSAVAHDVKLQVTGEGGQRVEVRVSERGGDVHVAVRTPDSRLAGELRQGLPSLAGRLEQSGFRAETWHPGAGDDRPRAADPPPGAASADSQNQPQNRQQQQQEQPEQKPREAEDGNPRAARKQQGKDFEWLLSSMQ